MKICLNAIVKNEAPVIRRCLESCKPLINAYVIVDTGSTDGTQDIIRECMAGIPGELHQRKWVDFGTNRSEALQLATPHGDYLLFIDADEVFVSPPNFCWPQLDADSYDLPVDYSGITYTRTAVVSTRLGWKWEGVLHEYLTSSRPASRGSLDHPRVFVRHDGARSRNQDTYKNDVAVLREALAREPNNARYAFYLAQSLRDAGDTAAAHDAYLHRAGMHGWVEETWYAKYEAARMLQALGACPSQAYLAAYQYRPTRAEPLYQLARYHRLKDEHALGYLYAKHGITIPFPTDRLFVSTEVYQWRLQDELGITAYYVGDHERGKAACLAAAAAAPEEERPRINQNLSYYLTAR